MNFNDVNKVAEYVRTQIMPNLSTHMQVADFGNYLSRLSTSPSFQWMKNELRVFPVSYFVDPAKFAKKYAKRCVSYSGTPSPQEGFMSVVYQVSPTFHVLGRLFAWVENDETHAYFMLICAYNNQKEYLTFCDDNWDLRRTGDTEEKTLGFGGMARSAGVDDIIRGFAAPISPDSGGEKGLEETP